MRNAPETIESHGCTYVRSDVFNPAWDQIKAAHESLREHMALLSEAQKENAALKEECRDLQQRLDRWNHGHNAIGTNHLVKRLKKLEQAIEERDALKARVEELEQAIHAIAPWLSASLDDESCQEYRAACERLFELDRIINMEVGEGHIE